MKISILILNGEGIGQKSMRVNQREIFHKVGIDNYNFYTIE